MQLWTVSLQTFWNSILSVSKSLQGKPLNSPHWKHFIPVVVARCRWKKKETRNVKMLLLLFVRKIKLVADWRELTYDEGEKENSEEVVRRRHVVQSELYDKWNETNLRGEVLRSAASLESQQERGGGARVVHNVWPEKLPFALSSCCNTFESFYQLL